MSEYLCRICAKQIEDKDFVDLFDSQNNTFLLQIKNLTGVRLKNRLGLPKLMCYSCKNDLISAYKFREDFLQVQKSFKVKSTRKNKKQTSNGSIEATEFIQVFAVKEENNKIFSSHDDHEVYGADEEDEINIEPQDFLKKRNLLLVKECKDQINALELNPIEENALEETKISIEIIRDKINDFDTTKSLSEDEFDDKGYDDDYYKDDSPESEISVAKKYKTTRKSKKSTSKTSKSKDGDLKKGTIKSKSKKRKDGEKHPKVFICDQCGNHFSCRHHFKLHQRRHTGDKQCACELCDDKFFTSSELIRHMRKHTGEKPFACKFCDRRFTDYSSRIKHERTHTNERPFKCSQCGKSFTRSYILKNHMLVHTGERDFKCEVCNKAFPRRANLAAHCQSLMHKQAVEKNKRPILEVDLPQPQCLKRQPPPQIRTLLV